MRLLAAGTSVRRAVAWTVIAVLALVGIAPDTAHAEGDAEAVRGRTFRIATDTSFPPHVVRDTDNSVTGLDIELIRAIAKDQGFEIELKPLGFAAALQAVETGQADGFIAAAGITDEREAVFDFADPYLESQLSLAVKEGEGERYQSWDDLKGETVLAKSGSLSLDHAKELGKKHGFRVRALDQSDTMYQEVTLGRAAAVMDDHPVLAYGARQGNGLEVVLDPIPIGELGFAVAKGKNADLRAAFNAGLANLKEDGTYDEIVDDWLGEKEAAERENFVGLLGSTLAGLLQGLGLTLLVTHASIVFASVLGLVFGFVKVSSMTPLRWLADLYVNVFRGTPLLVQAFFFYFGVPKALGIDIDILWTGILVLSLNAGAYMTEIVRGGIQSVPVGQMEASRSLGLSWLQAMNKVIAPQAIKFATPAAINQFIMTLKDTSILAVLGLAELTYQGQQVIARNFRSFEMWLIVGALYFVVIMLLTQLSNFLDRRYNK